MGTVYPVPYGGYSGQGAVIGLASTRALRSLHSYEVFRTSGVLHADYRPDKNVYRKHKLAVHEKIESDTGKKIFYVDALTGPQQQIVNVFAGHVPDLEKVEYSEADTYYVVRVPQADIVVVGLHHTLDYDTSDNPGSACNYVTRPARAWIGKPLLIFLMANIEPMQKVASRTIIAGDVNPGVIREMGALPARNFDEALAQAKGLVGGNPDILVLPHYYHDPKPIFEVV